jgi:hypothetical protein
LSFETANDEDEVPDFSDIDAILSGHHANGEGKALAEVAVVKPEGARPLPFLGGTAIVMPPTGGPLVSSGFGERQGQEGPLYSNNALHLEEDLDKYLAFPTTAAAATSAAPTTGAEWADGRTYASTAPSLPSILNGCAWKNESLPNKSLTNASYNHSPKTQSPTAPPTSGGIAAAAVAMYTFEDFEAPTQAKLCQAIDLELDSLVVSLAGWGKKGGGDGELCWRWKRFQRLMHQAQRKKVRAGLGRAKKRMYHPLVYGCTAYRSSTSSVQKTRAGPGTRTPKRGPGGTS